MAKESTATRVVLSGRISYPNLFTPKVAKGSKGDPKYSASIMILLTDTKEIAKVDKAFKAALEQGIEKKAGWDGSRPDELKLPFKKFPKGSTSQRLKKNPEYANHLVVSCSSKERPGVVDESLEDVLNANKIQAGDYCRFEVNFFPYDQGSNGVGCGLNHVQFMEEGEHFSKRGSAQDAFADAAENEDDDADDLIG